MAEVVLVHGIAQEQRQADDLEADWLPALAGGVRAAGHPDLADRLWRHGPATWGTEVRMAAYGDLFLPPDSQGDDDDLGDLTPEQQDLAVTLAAEWLKRAAARDGHPDQPAAAIQLAYLDADHEEQGRREEASRAALNGAARLRWFAPRGMAFAERFVNTSLRQVTSYFTDADLRGRIQQRVLAHLDPGTRVVIGHSLGSVIAYEVAAAHLNRPLPLLLTLGSPLRLRTVVYDRLHPQPPTYPPTSPAGSTLLTATTSSPLNPTWPPCSKPASPTLPSSRAPGPSTTAPSRTRPPFTSPSAKSVGPSPQHCFDWRLTPAPSPTARTRSARLWPSLEMERHAAGEQQLVERGVSRPTS